MLEGKDENKPDDALHHGKDLNIGEHLKSDVERLRTHHCSAEESVRDVVPPPGYPKPDAKEEDSKCEDARN